MFMYYYFPGDSSELVQPPAAALRSGPGAGTGRRDRGDVARPRRPPDVGHQRRLPAPREDLPGQHRPAVPARPGGMGELMTDCGRTHTTKCRLTHFLIFLYVIEQLRGHFVALLDFTFFKVFSQRSPRERHVDQTWTLRFQVGPRHPLMT